MKRIVLTITEDIKYKIIKELVDHNTNKRRATLKLGILDKLID